MRTRNTQACTLAVLCTLTLALGAAAARSTAASTGESLAATAAADQAGQETAKPDAPVADAPKGDPPNTDAPKARAGYVEAKAILKSSAPKSCNRTLTGYGFAEGCTQAACNTARTMAQQDLQGKITRGGGADSCFQYILVQPCVFTGCQAKTKDGSKGSR